MDEGQPEAPYPIEPAPAKDKRNQHRWLSGCVWVLVVLVAIVILFPIFAPPTRRTPNFSYGVRGVSLASIMYGADYDDRMPPLINGEWRNLQDVDGKQLTSFGAKRTDGWPLLLLAYTGEPHYYVDGFLGDPYSIWSGPPLAKGDAGYNPNANTYRNQSLFPDIGLNYQFLAPIRAPKHLSEGESPLSRAVGETRSFMATEDPARTIFFTPSQRHLNAKMGFFGINAPGMWEHLSTSSDYVALWSGRPCSGGWCSDANGSMSGKQRQAGSVREWVNEGRGPRGLIHIAFIDGHIEPKSFEWAASGTSFGLQDSESVVQQQARGDVVITDKSKYLWNLNDEFIDEAIGP